MSRSVALEDAPPWETAPLAKEVEPPKAKAHAPAAPQAHPVFRLPLTDLLHEAPARSDYDERLRRTADATTASKGH